MKALMVVDVQKEYMNHYDKGLLTAINERIDEAVKEKELIIYVKNVRNLKRGKVINEFEDGLNICSTDIFYKESASVFDNDKMILLLNHKNVTEIDVIGIDGCCCVARSAADASKLGYKVSISCKYIGIKNLERFEKKKELLIKQGVIIN